MGGGMKKKSHMCIHKGIENENGKRKNNQHFVMIERERERERYVCNYFSIKPKSIGRHMNENDNTIPDEASPASTNNFIKIHGKWVKKPVGSMKFAIVGGQTARFLTDTLIATTILNAMESI